MSRSIEELGHAYVGQISAPNSLKNCLAEISLHPADFKVQSFLCIASMSLNCDYVDSFRIDIESIW